jgi:cytosine/adenosine deaminase-related metal-dependent hydrolase
MKNKLIIPGRIVTNNSNDEIILGNAVEIKDDTITGIKKWSKKEIQTFKGQVIHAEHLTLVPGFIQTHIHLCQTLFRGLADDLQLLDWLQLKIFPFENAHNPASLKYSVRIGINELLLGGTTTILDMGTLRYQEEIFDELINAGMRAFAGKCMIDQNDLFPGFKSNTKSELNETLQLAKEFHNKSDLIKYGFAPRFVLSCSEELLKETRNMMQDFPGSIYHTHSSENQYEVAEVRKRFGKENIEFFNDANILSDDVVLAHCIHLNEKETGILKNQKTRVAHCPSSNLKLASGIAQIPLYLKNGISVSLGADGAPCNNSLSAFIEMRLAALIQKPIHGADALNAKTIFKLATIEGAKALHIDDKVGSIEPGKKADLVLLNLDRLSHSLSSSPEKIYSDLVYSASKEDVIDVMVNGKWVVRQKKSLLYDENELYISGKKQLSSLLKRL